MNELFELFKGLMDEVEEKENYIQEKLEKVGEEFPEVVALIEREKGERIAKKQEKKGKSPR